MAECRNTRAAITEIQKYSMFIRYRLLTELVSMWKKGELVEKIDSMPYEMYPRNRKPKGRCCIHKERAVVKYKTMAMMGFTMKDEICEMDPLSSYAKRMLERDGMSIQDGNVLHVMDEACSSCVKINYEVSNLCRGCVARPCYTNCPKDAIVYDKDGKAHIDHDKCIKCGACQKACGMDIKTFETPNSMDCIRCGACISACPKEAISSTWGNARKNITSRCFIDDTVSDSQLNAAELTPQPGKALVFGIILILFGVIGLIGGVIGVINAFQNGFLFVT